MNFDEFLASIVSAIRGDRIDLTLLNFHKIAHKFGRYWWCAGEDIHDLGVLYCEKVAFVHPYFGHVKDSYIVTPIGVQKCEYRSNYERKDIYVFLPWRESASNLLVKNEKFHDYLMGLIEYDQRPVLRRVDKLPSHLRISSMWSMSIILQRGDEFISISKSITEFYNTKMSTRIPTWDFRNIDLHSPDHYDIEIRGEWATTHDDEGYYISSHFPHTLDPLTMSFDEVRQYIIENKEVSSSDDDSDGEN